MAKFGIWKGFISFGLLNIPVGLKTANEEKEIHFSMLDEHDLSPIKYRKVNAKTGKEVPYERIVKGYEYEKDQYVIMDDADFKAANPKATQTIDIEDFVSAKDIDLLLFEKPYYLVPQKNTDKGYFLLRDALEKTGKVAIGKIVIRTKQHLVAVMPRGDYLILEMLRFAHQIIGVDQADYLEKKSAKYSDKELKMAEKLIEEMSVDWEPEKYDDTYFEDLIKRIKAKIKAGKGHTIINEPKESEEEILPSNVTDLLPLLKRSLEGKNGTSRIKKKSHG